jgi:hypothetical protein
MLFATLLSLRKKYTRWRIGRTQTWMRGHIWLGLLSYPLILFHAGMSFGHGLTFALMLIFSLVTLTGIAGTLLQHYLPSLMTERIERETIYYQIDRILGQLVDEADSLLMPFFRKDAEYGVMVPAATRTRTKTTANVLTNENANAGKLLEEAYENNVKPYLKQRGAYRHPLHDANRARTFFTSVRQVTPQAVHPALAALESVCAEKRELDRQSLLHRILYSWLLIHVPLAYGLILLGAIHAVMSLRYA